MKRSIGSEPRLASSWLASCCREPPGGLPVGPAARLLRSLRQRRLGCCSSRACICIDEEVRGADGDGSAAVLLAAISALQTRRPRTGAPTPAAKTASAAPLHLPAERGSARQPCQHDEPGVAGSPLQLTTGTGSVLVRKRPTCRLPVALVVRALFGTPISRSARERLHEPRLGLDARSLAASRSNFPSAGRSETRTAVGFGDQLADQPRPIRPPRTCDPSARVRLPADRVHHAQLFGVARPAPRSRGGKMTSAQVLLP